VVCEPMGAHFLRSAKFTPDRLRNEFSIVGVPLSVGCSDMKIRRISVSHCSSGTKCRPVQMKWEKMAAASIIRAPDDGGSKDL
jgi:hypothetical protein